MEGDNPERVEKGSKSLTGIPKAEFVENVNEFMNLPENDEVDKVLRRLDEQHSKYKLMEGNLIAKRKRLRFQIPDLERTLEVINKLKETKEEMETQFLLNDQVFVKASIPPTDTVCLWLGANVMLEYPLDEAEEVISSNVLAAKTNLETVENDLDFLRDQWTTTEVNMARVYNWDVKRRQASKTTS